MEYSEQINCWLLAVNHMVCSRQHSWCSDRKQRVHLLQMALGIFFLFFIFFLFCFNCLCYERDHVLLPQRWQKPQKLTELPSRSLSPQRVLELCLEIHITNMWARLNLIMLPIIVNSQEVFNVVFLCPLTSRRRLPALQVNITLYLITCASIT